MINSDLLSGESANYEVPHCAISYSLVLSFASHTFLNKIKYSEQYSIGLKEKECKIGL
jgi:hypothetical protein